MSNSKRSIMSAPKSVLFASADTTVESLNAIKYLASAASLLSQSNLVEIAIEVQSDFDAVTCPVMRERCGLPPLPVTSAKK